MPARNEAGCIRETIRALHAEMRCESIPHEIVTVDDGSTDGTSQILDALRAEIPELQPTHNPAPHGFGRAVIRGLAAARGDALVIVMADDSDDPRDAVRYWRALEAGYDCAFGSRFMPGGSVVDYPPVKWVLNRAANLAIGLAFRLPFDDTTNAFKAYRREAIDGCRPLWGTQFELTVELPLKAMRRGFSWVALPISWRNRRTGLAKLKIREMGSRYLALCWRVWRET